MSGKTASLAKNFTTPWTFRVYDVIPGNPIIIGIVFACALLTLFSIGRFLVEGGRNSTPADLRVAVTQIVMTAYSASAYAYLLMTARKTTTELSPVALRTAKWQSIVDRAGKYPKGLMPLIGAASYLVVGIAVTNATTPEPVNPWEWQNWNYDLYWHRATTIMFVWWIGCFCHATVVESARLSQLSDDVESLDLLELHPYRPLVRQGLTNALLVIGMVSVLSLLGVESRYASVLVGFWIMFVLLAWIGMMLPLRGIRRKIQIAKDQELDWCRQSLKVARDELKFNRTKRQSISEIAAYKTVIENIRNWPFDNSTVIRFTLYLMIPVGSWLGGAFVERGLDLFLS